MSFLSLSTIRAKLIALTAGLLVLLVGLGIFSIDRLSAVNCDTNEITGNWMPSIKAVARLDDLTAGYRRQLLLHVLSTDPARMEAVERDIQATATALGAARKAYEALISSPEEQAIYDRLSTNVANYMREAEAALALSRRNETEAVVRHIETKTDPIARTLDEDMDRLVALNEAGGLTAGTAAAASYESARTWTFVSLGLALVFGIVAAVAITRAIGSSMRAVTVPMGGLAAGDLSVEIPYRGQKTEVGQIADAVQVFKDALIAKKAADEAALAEVAVKAERARRLDALTATFETKVGGLVQALSSAATEMEATAQSMSATAEETDQQSVAVAAASEQAATNVQTVAGASEELSASIREIAGQVEQSSKIAGKGFAVVASEVKNLANQTAKATEEIAGQIAAIQGTTQGVVGAIRGIGGTIGEISEISATIASAVEEQRAATQEIARNVQEAARGTQEVTANIEGVKRASAETGAAATQVLGTAGSLAQQSEALAAEVKQFLSGVKAA